MMSNIKLRAMNYYKKFLATFFYRNTATLNNSEALLSFTFDDFPTSAYNVGGKILNQFGFKATYYVSFGLIGKNLPVGPAFQFPDVENLIKDGHELGCHTYDHLHSWDTKPAAFSESINKNRIAFEKYFNNFDNINFSYPKSFPRPSIKKITIKNFSSSRGGGQSFNIGKIDKNLLNAYFIDKKNNKDPQPLIELIDDTVRQKAWLIISTHDIDDEPSQFGCTKSYFSSIIEYAAYRGLNVLPVRDVINRFCR
jgi:peptidoglycan/xylan/chitin deacetylase (PgdA/CDA1 family)